MEENFSIGLIVELAKTSVDKTKKQLEQAKVGFQNAIKDVQIGIKQKDSMPGALEDSKKTLADLQSRPLNFNLEDVTARIQKISDLEKDISELETVSNSKFAKIGQFIGRLGDKFVSLRDKMPEIKTKVQEVATDIKTRLGEAFDNAKNKFIGFITKIRDKMSGNPLSNLVKGAKKFTLALIGARTVFTGIRKAMSQYLSQNEELQNKLNACWYALGSLFAPVLDAVLNVFIKLVGYVDALAKKLGFAGINMKNYAKNAKEANKQTAGFDELNNLSSDNGSGNTDIDFSTPIKSLSDLLDADAFSTKLKDIFGRIREVIGSIDWVGIGNDIRDFLFNIDWAGIFDSVFFVVGQVIGAGVALIWPTIRDTVLAIWNGLKSNFTKAFEDAGGDIIGGLLLGIWYTIKDVGTWLYDHVFKPIYDGFCSIFGIASPSKVFEDLGKFLVEGLFNGLSNIWDRIKEIFTNLRTNVKNVWETVKTDTIAKWENIKSTVTTKVQNIRDQVVNKFESMKSTITSIFETIKTKVTNSWTTMGNNIKTKANNIIANVERMINAVIDGINSWTAGLRSLGSKALSKLFGSDITLNGIARVSLPRLASGTNYVPNDMVAQIHKGEAVVPRKFNQDSYFNNEETNSLLEKLIDVVDSKEFKAYISSKEIGKTAVDYINSRSRIMGGALV